MPGNNSKRSSLVRQILTLMLFVCLMECAAGSCLSYGHSCWGAHGKRSGKPPASAPDWDLTRLLRRIAATDANTKRVHVEGGDLATIFRAEEGRADNEQNTNRITDNQPQEYEVRANPGIPMLDEELSKSKIWQIMRAAASYEN